MARKAAAVLGILCCAVACSPRDFLTRRLAADLIAGSETFKAPQLFWLRIGVVSNKDYVSPQYLVLQRRGWITATNAPCGPVVGTPPCWDVTLSPLGVEAFRGLLPGNATESQYFSIPVARRILTAVTGISKNGNVADVDFQWKWVALNEVGAALYAGGVQYNSTVTFKHYDDGWRLIEGGTQKNLQGLEDALKEAVPTQ
jgi:hypothetical protein